MRFATIDGIKKEDDKPTLNIFARAPFSHHLIMKISERLIRRQRDAHAKKLDHLKVLLELVKKEAIAIRGQIAEKAFADADEDYSWMVVKNDEFPSLFQAIAAYKANDYAPVHLLQDVLSEVFEIRTESQSDGLSFSWSEEIDVDSVSSDGE